MAHLSTILLLLPGSLHIPGIGSDYWNGSRLLVSQMPGTVNTSSLREAGKPSWSKNCSLFLLLSYLLKYPPQTDTPNSGLLPLFKKDSNTMSLDE
jgi:hypothetical protein